MDLNHKQAQIFCPTFMPQRLEEKKLEIKNKQTKNFSNIV